jgi:hypothetical protein
VVKLSGSEWIVVLGFSILWAILGYMLSENDRKRLGRTPWGLPSPVWAFFWFLSLIVGLVLYLIAHSAGTRRAQQSTPSVGGSPTEAAMGLSRGRREGPTVAEQFPSYPQPANRAAPPAPVQTEAAPHSPPAWHADPSGRFHYRWWDGQQWTSHVSTDGRPLIDTHPDQRIGPY